MIELDREKVCYCMSNSCFTSKEITELFKATHPYSITSKLLSLLSQQPPHSHLLNPHNPTNNHLHLLGSLTQRPIPLLRTTQIQIRTPSSLIRHTTSKTNHQTLSGFYAHLASNAKERLLTSHKPNSLTNQHHSPNT